LVLALLGPEPFLLGLYCSLLALLSLRLSNLLLG
jgi:hypothetical protein